MRKKEEIKTISKELTLRKTIALTRQAFVGKVMSLLFNMLSRLVITFLPRSNVVGALKWPPLLLMHSL